MSEPTSNDMPVGPSNDQPVPVVPSENIDVPPVSYHISSLAACNPTRDIVASQVWSQETLTNAQKITTDAKHKLNKENASALQLDIVQFSNLWAAKITQIAKKFNKMESHIKQLLTSETHYHNTCAPSLQNALVHAKGVEMNESK